MSQVLWIGRCVARVSVFIRVTVPRLALLTLLVAASASADTVTYTYDGIGRLKTITYTDGTSVTYALDGAGNRVTVTTVTPNTTPPTVPTGLTATAISATQVNLSWTASTDAGGSGLAGYKIYRGGTQIATSTTASYSDTTVSGSTTYSYTVAAYDGNNNVSAQSTAAGVTTPTAADTTPPTVPTGLAASAPSSTLVNLTWTASTDSGGSGLAGYKIYRGGTQIGTSTTASYSDSTVSGTTAYSYTVAAYDNANNVSAQSTAVNITTPDTIPPSVPIGLSGTAVSATQINLTWTASTDTGGSGLAGYKIYRGGAQIGTSTTASYSDTTVVGSSSYSYTVAAYDNASNTSAQSSPASVSTPDITPPSVPTGLTGSAVSATQINLSWGGSTDTGGSGLAGYKIYRGGVQIGTTAATSYSDTTVVGSTTYAYTVAAYDNAGNTSSQTAVTNVSTPDITPPSVPTGLTATAVSSAQVNLSWSASTDTGGSGLAGYKLYRGGALLVTTASTSYSDTSVAPSTAYSYTVAAYDNAGNVSAQSAASNVTTPAGVPPNPTLSSSTLIGTAGVYFTLSWTASTGATSYKLLSSGTAIYTGTALSQQVTEKQGDYSFTVQACNTVGCDAGSNAVAVTICPANGCP
jgi:YD repeat-containing protein